MKGVQVEEVYDIDTINKFDGWEAVAFLAQQRFNIEFVSELFLGSSFFSVGLQIEGRVAKSRSTRITSQMIKK